MLTIKNKIVDNVQYIKTTRELVYEERKGRYTQLLEGVPGFIINGDIIDWVEGSDEQLSDCFDMLEKANREGKSLALVQGRLCILDESDFYRCDPPKMYPITNKIF